MAEQGPGADVASEREDLTDADVARIEGVVRRVVRARVRDEARVVDLRDAVDPDVAVVDADIAAAMREALDDLEPDRREALVAHELRYRRVELPGPSCRPALEWSAP